MTNSGGSARASVGVPSPLFSAFHIPEGRDYVIFLSVPLNHMYSVNRDCSVEKVTKDFLYNSNMTSSPADLGSASPEKVGRLLAIA